APGGMSPGAGGADREAPGAGGEHGAGGPGAAKTGPGAEKAAPAAEKAAPGAEKPQRAEGGQPAKEGRPGGNAPAAAGAAGHGGHANLSGDQRTKFKGAIRSHHVEAIHGADFAVRAGTIIPDHYHFYPLPPELIEIVPEYEGYDYILVDNEIIILEPGTRRIVDIIED
uniref:DUF1236 domain-containing protein n=1 Tax=Beijerinckia sp. L45 TaxID=1641855 RepID=UPI00131CEAC0